MKGFRHAHFSLSKMHSAKGTARFKTMSKGAQRSWAGQDSKRSRRGMMKNAGMHGRGGSHH